MKPIEWFKMLLGLFIVGAFVGSLIAVALGLVEYIMEALK